MKKLRPLVSQASEHGLYMKLVNGTVIEGKSADNPVGLLGEGVDELFIDECSLVDRGVWEEALRPTLADKKGKASFIGTPKGKNWFWELFVRGKNEKAVYESWQFPTADNPIIDPKEVDSARESLPDMKFRQEFLAEFVELHDTFFPMNLITKCVDKDLKRIQRVSPTEVFYAGVDLARLGEDSTVIITVKWEAETRTAIVADIVETKHELLTQAIGRIRKLDEEYKYSKIFLDPTGLGAGVLDVLREQIGGRAIGVTFTIQAKEDLFNNLKLLMERGVIHIPKHDKLLFQLNDLRYEYKSSGHQSIHHSDNGHDDYPDAFALAVWFYRSGMGKVSYNVF